MVSPEPAGHLSTEELFRRHASFVARFLTRLGVPAQQLEDAIQQVFLVVHRNGGYRPGLAQPTSYLASIAIYAAAQQRRRRCSDSKVLADAPTEHIPSSSPDPAQALHVRQELQRLQLALERMPEELRTTLLLVDVEGESCVSLAAALGSPVGTIYWRLHQARQQLHSTLKVIDASRTRRRVHAAPARSSRALLAALGPLGFGGSEASRLLQLCREQPAPALPFEELWSQHQQLIQSSVELPGWSAACPARAASWGSVIGVGPIAASALVGVVVVTGALDVAVVSPVPPATAVLAAGVTAPSQVASQQPPVAATPLSAGALGALPPDEEFPGGKPSASAAASPGLPAADQGEQGAPPRAAKLAAKRAARPSQSSDEPTSPAASRSSRKPAAELGEAALVEMREVALAERLLASDPERALELAREMPKRFPNGYFGEERAYLEVMALRQLGRTREMRDRASAYLRVFPLGLYGDRVRRALASTSD